MFTPSHQQIVAYHTVYRKKGGRRAQGDFAVKVVKFFDFTFEAFVEGTGSRTEAFQHWVEHIGSEREARLFFEAVDSVDAYS